jgi:Ca2+-binding RTX toxin-like protein
MRGLATAVFLLLALAGAGVAQAGTVSVTGNDDVIFVAAASEENRVVVAAEVDPVEGLRIVDLGAPVTAEAGCSSVGANEAFCAGPTLGGITLTLDDEDDWANTSAVSERWGVRLYGGDGNDSLYSGSNRYALQDGGPGADYMSGDGATVDYSARTAPLTVTTGDGLANDGEAGEGDNVDDPYSVLCGGGADTVTVNGFNMLVVGGAGNDELIDFGDGATGLAGGPGDDFLRAVAADSGLNGGGGADTLIGGNDAQSFDGGSGKDLLRGGPGRDSMFGGPGADELIGGQARDKLRGGSGNDTFRARDGSRDVIRGDSGTDRAHIDEGLDLLNDVEELF